MAETVADADADVPDDDGEAEADPDDEADPDAEADPDGELVADGEAGGELDGDGEGLSVPSPELADEDGEGEALDEADGEGDGDGELVDEPVGDGDGEPEAGSAWHVVSVFVAALGLIVAAGLREAARALAGQAASTPTTSKPASKRSVIALTRANRI